MRDTSKIQWGRYSPALLSSYYSGDQKYAFELVQVWLESGLIAYVEAAGFSQQIKANQLGAVWKARDVYGGLYAGLINVTI